MSKINLGMFCPNPNYWMGGANYYLRLCQLLDNYSDNIHVTIFIQKNIDDDLRRQFEALKIVNCVYLERTQQSIFGQISSLVFGMDFFVAKLIKKYNISILLENACFYGWALKIPVISWIPDLQHAFLPHFFSFKTRLKRDIGFYLQSKGNRRIMLSSFDAKSQFCNRYKVKCKSKIDVVRFSVKKNNVSKLEIEKTLNKFNISSKFIFVPNHYWPHKNHKLIIDAIAKLKGLGLCSYQIISTGNIKTDYYSEVLEYAKLKGVTCEEFISLGFVSSLDVCCLMHAASAVINPSLFEGWSTPVEEAKSLNKYLLLSDIEIHREQVKNNASFFGVKDIDRLSTLIDSRNIFECENEYDDSRHFVFYNEFSVAINNSFYNK